MNEKARQQMLDDRTMIHAALGLCLDAVENLTPRGVVAVAHALIALCGEEMETTVSATMRD